MIGKVTDSPGMPQTEAIGAKVLARYCGDTQNKCASQRCLCNDPGAVVSLLNSWDIHNLFLVFMKNVTKTIWLLKVQVE